jgi:hypothetical protein
MVASMAVGRSPGDEVDHWGRPGRAEQVRQQGVAQRAGLDWAGLEVGVGQLVIPSLKAR